MYTFDLNAGEATFNIIPTYIQITLTYAGNGLIVFGLQPTSFNSVQCTILPQNGIPFVLYSTNIATIPIYAADVTANSFSFFVEELTIRLTN